MPRTISGLILVLLALRVAGPVCAAAAAGPAKEVSVLVVVQGEPASAATLRPGSNLAAAAQMARRRAGEIQAQHDVLVPEFHRLGARVTGRFCRLLNAVRLSVPAEKLSELRALPSVVRVEQVVFYERQTASSVPFIGAPGLWGPFLTNATGEGVRVGIIDTGIDYTHAAFGGPGTAAAYTANDRSVIEPGTFPTAKVVGGYDFAGDAYQGDSNPQPDPDPLDCADTGHGTHVASIAGGLGVLTNGQTYAGSYDASLDFEQFSIGPGVAPRARLYALKVFGCTGSTGLVIDALEWAADPNQDFNFSDRLDVVNISIGQAFVPISPNYPDQLAVNQLAHLGCVVVISAGNSGSAAYSVSSPGVAERAIAVANSIDGGIELQQLQVISPAPLAGVYRCIEGGFTRPLQATGPITNRLVLAEPTTACQPLQNPSAVSGKIALMDRGLCRSPDKIKHAQNAGAIAVVMVNSVDGPPFVMAGSSNGIHIPAVMVSRADGERLKQWAGSNVMVRLDALPRIPAPELADQLDPLSSRGPSALTHLLKPDLAAPGHDIQGARMASGTEGLTAAGTSSAAPHVSGAAALLRQIHPGWSAEQIKAALMNTAVALKDGQGRTYPESWTGAGRIHLPSAARTELTAIAEGSTGLVSLCYGALELTNTYNALRQVRLTNHGTNAIPCEITVSNTVTETGFMLRPLNPSLIVPPLSSVLVPFELTGDPAQFDRTLDPVTAERISGEARHGLFEASGQIWFHNPVQPIHLPFYGSVRAASRLLATVARVGTPATSNEFSLRVPTRGHSAHPAPLVSAFQLGFTSPNRNLTNPLAAAGDLLAVGVASDKGLRGSLSQSTLYFGIATAKSWPTPNNQMVSIILLIDINRDGAEDFALYNSNAGNLALKSVANRDSANDIFRIVVTRGFSTGHTNGGYLNVFPADQRDTAPFNNSVVVYAVPGSLLGLTDANPRINYRVLASINIGGAIQETEDTDWFSFDPAHLAVDTTRFGIAGTPFHAEGQSVRITMRRDYAATNGFNVANPPTVLLLHHQNLPGQRFDLVRLDLGTEDVDTDQLPDWWELDYFADLAGTAQGDPDADGFPNLNELRAGTDPSDSRSALRIIAAGFDVANGFALTWSSVTGKLYSVQRTTNLAAGFQQTIAQGLSAAPPANTFRDTNASFAFPAYYRVRVQ